MDKQGHIQYIEEGSSAVDPHEHDRHLHGAEEKGSEVAPFPRWSTGMGVPTPETFPLSQQANTHSLDAASNPVIEAAPRSHPPPELRQFACISAEICAAINEVLRSQQFILGAQLDVSLRNQQNAEAPRDTLCYTPSEMTRGLAVLACAENRLHGFGMA
ncbi:MAG TPA: hypothetical protein VHM88_20670 [Candidatus Acidoferrales bacterium]|nr:hypothetical protein [Candidatus Acidoferrales bacterium]